MTVSRGPLDADAGWRVTRKLQGLLRSTVSSRNVQIGLGIAGKRGSMNVMDDLNDFLASDEARRYVYRVALRMLRDDDTAQDVTQDAMLLAHRRRDQFRGDSAHRTWLYRIAVNSALEHLRKQKRRREELRANAAVDVVDWRPSPEREAAANELVDHVRETISRMAPAHADPLLLRALGWAESEIASRLGITVANVKVRAFRMRHRLREAIAA